MKEFKKNDRVCWISPIDAHRMYGHVQGKLRALYVVLDDAGKEWMMYAHELLPVK